MNVPHAPRLLWRDFPAIVIATTDEKRVKHHVCYADAKSGDPLAAALLVREFCTDQYLACLSRSFRLQPNVRLAAVHAEEEFGRNQIAQALSVFIANRFDLALDDCIVQINIVNHTGAKGFARLASQALFEGDVERGCEYLLVDDFVGQGGTMANFRGHIETLGGLVIGATVVTGKPYSAKIALTAHTLSALRSKHGSALEYWWEEQFGFGFDCLTESEARYLCNTADADAIRNRILEDRQT